MPTPVELIRLALDGDAIHTDAIVTKQHADDLAAELAESFASLGLRIVKTVPNSPGESDPRLTIATAWLALAGVPDDRVKHAAEELLDELDNQSPDPTIRRLQQTIAEMMGDDAVEWNLARATMIVNEMRDLADVQSELKRAFKNDELDGGWKTALEHPLYLQAEARKASLQDELKGLI